MGAMTGERHVPLLTPQQPESQSELFTQAPPMNWRGRIVADARRATSRENR
jgi:hypothetical protein